MHMVDDGDRVRRLNDLKRAIEALLPIMSGIDVLRSSVAAYEACLAEVVRLIAEGSDQEQLSSLSRAIPRLFWLHKEWTPQLERTADGLFREPAWFAAADTLHQHVQDAAEELRIVGRY
jgi:hypothetical protein